MEASIRDKVIRTEEKVNNISEKVDEIGLDVKSFITRIEAVERKQSNVKYFIAGVASTCSAVGALVGVALSACIDYFHKG